MVSTTTSGTRFYEHGEHRVTAVRFGYLVENYLDGVDWSHIDGSSLPRLYRLGTPGEGSG